MPASHRPACFPSFFALIAAVLMAAACSVSAQAANLQNLVADYYCREKCENSPAPCCLELCAYQKCIKDNSGITMQRGAERMQPGGKHGPSFNIGLPGSGQEAIPACKPVEAVMKTCFERNWDKNAYCENLARQAKQQTDWAREHHCNVSGEIWVNDAATYAARCKGLHKPRQTMREEEYQRDRAVGMCRQHESLCRRYAALNAEQQRRNRAMRCEQSGPDWELDQNAYFDQCHQGGWDVFNLEQGNVDREKTLRKCQDQRMAEQRDLTKACYAAARLAVRDQAENQALGCGYSGPQWTSDQDAFFQACVKNRTPSEQLRAQHKARQALLAQCRARAEKGQEPAPAAPKTRVLAQGVKKFTAEELVERYRRNKHDWWTIPEVINIPAPGVITVDSGLEVDSSGIGCHYGGGIGVRKVGESVGQPPGQEFPAGSYHVDFQVMYNANMPAYCDQEFHYKVTYTPSQS